MVAILAASVHVDAGIARDTVGTLNSLYVASLRKGS